MILRFFELRAIEIESMNLQSTGVGKAVLKIHCRIPKDKIRYITGLMQKIEFIDELELLEGRISYKSI